MIKRTIVAALAGVFIAGPAAHADDRVKNRYDSGYTQERFNRADTDGDGYLTLEEARATIQAFEGDNGRDRFHATDADGDGKISLEEATNRKSKEKQVVRNKGVAGQEKVYNRERFDTADTNSDGYVTWDEAVTTKHFADRRGRERFDRADANGDGKLSLDEAIAARQKERNAF